VELAAAHLIEYQLMSMPFKIRAVVMLAGLLVVPGSFGNISDARTLRFYHTHTGQDIEISYYRDGGYDSEALQQLNAFLADWRNAEQQEIDPVLFDILWKIQQQTANQGIYEVISAYRSPQTNEMLRNSTTGVAQSSQHISGNAIDVRLRGLDTELLRDTARALKLGGVGYYAASDFVHIDTGRPRYW
jgi:uncharacterized protein YcbK (DUF882 family)